MNTRFLFPFLGLAVVVAVIGGSLYLNRGSRVVLRGEIKKVRTHEVEKNSSVAIVDFSFANPATILWWSARLDFSSTAHPAPNRWRVPWLPTLTPSA